MLTRLRVADETGPVFDEAALFPVVMLRAAAHEAHDAIANSIKKWAKGTRASMPRFRSTNDPRAIKLSAFSLKRCDSFEPSSPETYGPPIPQRLTERPVMTFIAKGLGKLKARLSRPLPLGHVPVELHLTRHPDGRAEMRVISRGPAAPRAIDPAEAGRLVHAAVKHLPADAPNLAYVEAARAAGQVVRGGDVGLLAPIATSDGLVSRPVRCSRAEMKAVKENQRHEARRGTKRSQAAEHARKRAAKAQRKTVNRRRTRAYQDAAMLVCGNGPKNGNSFLRKHDQDGGREPVVIAAMEERSVERGVVQRSALDRTTEPEAWKRRRARNTARRIAETGMNLRVRRVAELCRRRGALSVEVEPRGTTRECTSCGADVRKDLGERTHRCPACGFTTDRDNNAALNALGRAFRQFRDTPDPGERITAAHGADEKAREKRRRKAIASSKGGRTRGARFRYNGGVVAPNSKHQGDGCDAFSS
jgi:predicted RNA-binding Zn-ribbon protein involved in translation (DUF1610 family)